jgi:hypothetical protein
VGLLPALTVLFLASDSSASEPKPGERVVGFDPSISMVPSPMVYADYSDNPTMLRFRTEYRASAVLSKPKPGTELYEVRKKAMEILTPGDPCFSVYAPRQAEIEVPSEKVKSDSIELWQGYKLSDCSPALESVAQWFQCIADYSGLDELTRNHYGALAQAAFYFASAFDMLQEDSLSSKQIAEKLKEYFRDNPGSNQVRGVFYAVEERLKSELLRLSKKEAKYYYNEEPKYRNMECIKILGALVVCGSLIVLKTLFP